MSRLVWAAGWVGVAVWSLFCAAAYGFFDIVGRAVMRNADVVSSDPYVVEGVWRVLNALHTLSTGAVTVGWALVSLLILSVPWLLDRMLGGGSVVRARTVVFTSRRQAEDGVIDLAPDQYTVSPGDTRAAASGPGSVPRMPRRP